MRRYVGQGSHNNYALLGKMHLSRLYLSVFLHFTADYRPLNSTVTNVFCAARVLSPCTSVDYTVILGVPILPVPTLIEFLN